MEALDTDEVYIPHSVQLYECPSFENIKWSRKRNLLKYEKYCTEDRCLFGYDAV